MTFIFFYKKKFYKILCDYTYVLNNNYEYTTLFREQTSSFLHRDKLVNRERRM